MKLSILIPSSDQVVSLERILKQLPKGHEIIVAGKPEQQALVEQYGAKWVPGSTMRGLDFNQAAKHATGDVYALLHQNTIHIPKQLFNDIKKTMQSDTYIGGAVNVVFDSSHWLMTIVTWMSNNYRMRLRNIPYIDQTIFVRADVFKELNGFKAMPIFEDTDFSVRLRKQGKLAFLDGPVKTSAHRFVRNGVLFHTMRNQIVKIMYTLGVPLPTIKTFYEWTTRTFVINPTPARHQ